MKDLLSSLFEAVKFTVAIDCNCQHERGASGAHEMLSATDLVNFISTDRPLKKALVKSIPTQISTLFKNEIFFYITLKKERSICYSLQVLYGQTSIPTLPQCAVFMSSILMNAKRDNPGAAIFKSSKDRNTSIS